MKKKFYVSVTEILNRVVCVEAEDEHEAKRLVRKAYYDDQSVVLDYNDYVDAEIKVEDNQEDYADAEESGWHYQMVQ